MKSITLLMYKPAEGQLEVRARDLSSRWLTALTVLDDDTYLAADNAFNLVRGGGGGRRRGGDEGELAGDRMSKGGAGVVLVKEKGLIGTI